MAKKKKKSVSRHSKNASKSKSKAVDFSVLEEFVGFMKKNGVTEMEWSQQGVKVHMRTDSGVGVSNAVAVQPTFAASASSANMAAPAAASKPPSSSISSSSSSATQIVSPFVGTFYTASSPDSDPYVRSGQQIKPGDVLCIVEAMKLMNEIECEKRGKIIEILVEDGQPVEFGEPLFLIEE